MVSKESLNSLPVGIITGPTATGKTSLAVELAQKHGGIEIINADSLLVYRHLNIGTAKPTAQELSAVPHHLIDIRDPDENYTLGEFYRDAQSAIQDIHQRGKRALVVGGTGFYLQSLLYGLWEAPPSDPSLRAELSLLSNEALFDELLRFDPQSATRTEKSDRYRLIRAIEIVRSTGKSPRQLQDEIPQVPNPHIHLWILDRTSPEIQNRIHLRTQEMIRTGIIKETEEIHQKYPKCRGLGSVGYVQTLNYILGNTPKGRKVKSGLEGLSEEIELATRQLVKKQRTWFRGQSRKIPQSRWFELERDLEKLKLEFNQIYL